MMGNSVSIVIVTRDRYDDLLATAESLRCVDTSSFDFVELVIVDNGSVDNTHIAKDWGFDNYVYKYIHFPLPGKCGALNVGMDASTGGILVFTDDDVRLRIDWLCELVGPIINNMTDACAGRVVLAPGLERPWMTDLHRAALSETVLIDRKKPGSMIGANMAFKKDVLNVIPGFDVETGPGKLGFGDDTLFSFQLIEAGFRIQFCENAVVIHHCGSDRLLRQAWLKRAYNAGRSQAYIDYNWHHKDYPEKESRLGYLRMKWRSIRQGWLFRRQEGISEAEFYYYHNKGYYSYFESNSNFIRTYNRHGFVKV